MPTSIIIPVFNQARFTEQCLKSLLKNQGKEKFEIIAVDNGSSDDTSAVLQSFQKLCQFLQLKTLKENVGFARACNEGARAARYESLVFLNNDTFVTENWLENLLHAFNRLPQCGIAGPRLVFPDTNRINHAGSIYLSEERAFAVRYLYRRLTEPPVLREVEVLALLGACLLIRKDIFSRVGGFSNFGLEDIDLCLKVRQLGLKAFYVPSSLVYHHGSITLSQSVSGSIPESNASEFIRKWEHEKIVELGQGVLPEDDSFDPQAMNTFTQEVSRDANESIELVRHALNYLQQGASGEARALLGKALQLWPGNENAHEELVIMHLRRQKMDEVREALDKWQAIKPGSEMAGKMEQLLAQQQKSRKDTIRPN